MLGDGQMRAKICPDCGQHNSVHALWCLGCGRMLPVDTIIELEARAPESEGSSHVASEPRADPESELPPGPGAVPTAAPGIVDEQVSPGAHSPPEGGAANTGGQPDDAPPSYALIPEDPRRGGCLSLWLVGVMVTNGIGILLILGEGTFDLVACGLGVANILFAAALWHLKRWGVYGLAGSFSLAFVLGLVIQDLYTIASSILPMILLIALVKPKWDLLE